MKKILAYILVFILFMIPSTPLSATGDLSFWSAMGNLAEVGDHKSIQSFYGSVDFEDGEDHISADFRVSISTTIDEGTRNDSFNRVSAFLKFINHNEINDSTPFREMTVQANGEIITQNQDDMYLKLNNFNIGLKEPLPFAIVDVENVMAMMSLYRGTWYHSSAEELAADEDMIDLEEYMAMEEQIKEDPKGAIYDLTEMSLYDSGLAFSEEEIGDFMDAVELMLEAKLFTERDIVAGRNTGFKFFNLNKGAVMDLMTEIAAALGEEITYEDRMMLRSALGKFSLSGIYRIEDTHDIVDNLLIRLRLRELESLSDLEFNYRFKIWDIGRENSVRAPSQYEEWEEVFGGFEENSYYDDMWFEDEYYYDDYEEVEPKL